MKNCKVSLWTVFFFSWNFQAGFLTINDVWHLVIILSVSKLHLLRVAAPSPEKGKKERGSVYKRLVWIIFCDITPFARKYNNYYNSFSLPARSILSFKAARWLKINNEKHTQPHSKMAVRLLTSEMEEKHMYTAALSQVCGESHVHVCIIEVSILDMRIENILYCLMNLLDQEYYPW